MNPITKLPFLLFLSFLLFVGGAYAAWIYAPPIGEVTYPHPLQPTVGEFTYKLEEILPGDENNSLDENHVVLVTQVLHHRQYGLNGSKDVIQSVLDDYGIAYARQKVTGGNLKHLRDAISKNTNAANLDFVIEKVSDSVYYTYSFSLNDLYTVNGEPVVLQKTRITVYKTVMVCDSADGEGTWDTPQSYVGTAVVFEPAVDNVDRSIGVDTWIQNNQ